ncbi:APC family permease [Neobacillus massiliamazoniensis]|uniref:Amino acid permease-associated protein n=1 Tax=Neobacillus massiliamazoniensis TaxID=1499688 RepID=A0A0U1NYH9_9BACI|nr:APC family permease [Neobacillus massiliamazoniensis]CRK83056.1 amino acid permease-associated protein [Neobacillus massiliamazoniensis]
MESQESLKNENNDEHTLKRNLHSWHVLGLSMADVSPTMAVLLLTAGVFSVGGTFAIGSNLILAVIVVMIAFTLGELSSMYPFSGGMYSLVSNVLPKPLSWIAMFNFLIQGIILPASFALGIADFLRDLIPGIHVSNQVVALITLTLAMIIAIMRVELGAWVTFTMVIVEVGVLVTVIISAFINPHQSFMNVTFHPVMLKDGHLGPVTFGIMIATLAPAFNVINGYDAVLGFSEEMKGGPRALAKTVIMAAVLAAVLIIIPLIAGVIAAPDLEKFFSSNAPIVYSVKQALGPQAGALINIGAIIALFNAALSMFMYFSRVFYATGRDNIWTPAFNKALFKLNKHRVPAVGVMVLFIPSIVFLFVSQLNWLIIFAGTVITVVYFFIGLAGIWSRINNKTAERPYKMPLWPLPSLIVVLFTGFAFVTQETQYLIGEIILATASLICYAFFSRTNNSAKVNDKVVTDAK